MIRPITRQVILEGTGEWTPCYMFGISKRGFQCSMWLEIFDEVGGIGYVPYVEDKPVGTREWYDLIGQLSGVLPGLHLGGQEDHIWIAVRRR
jgi:hypothetical protein